ncbi:MAG: hypothetical protein IPP82_17205 [Xanthomonadales bacterium]|nr:hypothetical protein [Xanthomonadales bacterium]
MLPILRTAALALVLNSSAASAQVFVLDPYFGTGGIATYEWPVANGYQWDAVDAWAVHLADGKWAVATQLRDGTSQIAAVNWFDANGQVTPGSPGAGAYTPFTRFLWNLAGLSLSSDGSLTLGTSFRPSSSDIDFLAFRAFVDGTPGYSACNGTFFQQVFFDLAPPSAIDDVMGAITQDFIGRQVMVGTLTSGAGESRIGVARIQPQCGLDASFNGTGKQVVDPNPYTIFPPPRRAHANAVIHDAIGRILVGGGVTFGLNNTDDGACIVVRLLSTGQRDPNFGNNGVAYINSFTQTPGNIRCDVRGLAVQTNGRIIVNMDWTLTNAQGTSRREYNQRLTDQGGYDPSWVDPCCTVGFSNVEVKAGGTALMEGDAVALIVYSSLTNQVGVDDARGTLIPLRLSDGSYASGFIANGQLPLGLASASYHRVIAESADSFIVVATSGDDLFNHRRVHLLRYRRASTIPDDTIFRNGFEP